MGKVSFQQDVLPLLVRFCKVDYPDNDDGGEKREGHGKGEGHGHGGEHGGGLHTALTDYASLMASGFVVPGKAEESELYEVLVEKEMPKDVPYFTDEECDVIKNWINQGAEDDTPKKKSVIVMGGGAAGLCAGVTLIEKGFDVTIITDGQLLGGKAKSWRDPAVDSNATQKDVPGFKKNEGESIKYKGPATASHGFHAVFGFYLNFIDILKKVGAYKNLVLNNHEFHMQDEGEFHTVKFWKLPYPLHLFGMLFYSGFSLYHKIRYAIWGFNIFRKDPKKFKAQDYNDFATWSRGKGLNYACLRSPFFRMLQEGDFNYPQGLSGFAGLKGVLAMMMDYDATGMYYFNGGTTEVIWNPIGEYFKEKGGKILFSQKVIHLNCKDEKISGIIAATPKPYPGKPWPHGVVQTEPGTETEYVADYYISTLPPDCFKELNQGDGKFWNHIFFRNMWAFDTVPTYTYTVWLNKTITPEDLRYDCMAGFDEPFSTIIDYKHIIDEYKEEHNVKSVLDMVGGEGSFRQELTPDGDYKGGWSDEELKDLALNNLVKYDAFREARKDPDNPNSGFNKDLIMHEFFHVNRDNSSLFFVPTPKTYKYRPGIDTLFNNLKMAGDWVQNDYMPVISIEGACISGKMAANTILKENGMEPVEILIQKPPFLLELFRMFYGTNFKATLSFVSLISLFTFVLWLGGF